METKRVSLDLDSEVARALKAIAAEQGVTMAQVLRKLVGLYVNAMDERKGQK